MVKVCTPLLQECTDSERLLTVAVPQSHNPAYRTHWRDFLEKQAIAGHDRTRQENVLPVQ
jgi:hypothetical protein